MPAESLKTLIDQQRASLERRNPRYGRVFFALRRRYDLTSEACLLLDVVATLSRKTGWCFASREYLAGLFGVASRTVQRHLSILKEKGLIEVHPSDPRLIRAVVSSAGDDKSR